MGVRRVYTAGSPYNGVELDDIDFEQTTDTMYLAHWDHTPTKLVRAGHTSWSFTGLTFGPTLSAPTGCSAAATTPNTDTANSGENYFPQPATYCVTAVDDETGEESRASNESSATNDLTLKRNYNTITWSAVTGATRYNVYKADNQQFFGYIGTTESLTFRDDNIGPALDRAPPEGYNPFPAANDYPGTITLFEQRAIWGYTRNAPNAAWGTRSAQLENFDRSRPRRADDSIAFSIVAGRVNSIYQLVATTSLLALASDNIFVIDGDGSGGVLAGNAAPAARRQIGRGASRLGPLVIDNVVFYAPNVGESVRTINYKFELDGLTSNDVSIFSPHFFEGYSIVAWAYAQEPRSLIVAVRSDGKAVCFTWEQEQNVWGWTLWETDGSFLGVCSISENGEDRLYFIVERTVNGEVRRYVERLGSHNWEDLQSACYMDSSVAGTFPTARSIFSGLWHLEGRHDVVGMCDGAVYEGLSVHNGFVVLPEGAPDALEARFGIPYTTRVKTHPVRTSIDGIGSTVGRRQQPGDIVLHLYKSSGITAGTDEDSLYPVKLRRNENYDTPDDLFTGETEPITTKGKVTNSTSVTVQQTKPLPFAMLGISVDPLVGG